MELENLIFEKAPIAMVTVNRPKALNALNVRVVEELAQVLQGRAPRSRGPRADYYRSRRPRLRGGCGYRRDVRDVRRPGA